MLVQPVVRRGAGVSGPKALRFSADPLRRLTHLLALSNQSLKTGLGRGGSQYGSNPRRAKQASWQAAGVNRLMVAARWFLLACPIFVE